ncbi:MAG: metal-sulfur cluster assembly factor [Actinomycetota bacterium]
MDEKTLETEQSAGETEPSAPATRDERPATVDDVREAIRVVVDPEIGISIVDLGLVYDITVDEDGVAKITYTLTSMGCPVGPLIEAQMQQVVSLLPGLESAEFTMVFKPPWTPEMMSDEAKAALGYL